MERRSLSDFEMAAIQKEIATKELAVLEVLAEVYDHFVSHLELQKKEDFWSELDKLKKKWNYSYCQSIQEKYLKTALQSRNRRLIKSFSRLLTHHPHILLLMGLVLLFFITSSLQINAYLLGIITPIFLGLLVIDITESYQIQRKFKTLKGLFSYQRTGLVTYSAERFPFVNTLFYLFSIGKLWIWKDAISEHIPIQFIILAAIGLSLILIVKIQWLAFKSKTAFV